MIRRSIRGFAVPPGLNPTRNRVVDLVSLQHMRAQLKRMKEDATLPAGARVSQELSFVHLLSQMSDEANLRECLAMGDRLWNEVTEMEVAMRKRDPGGFPNNTLQLCASLRRAASKLGDTAREEMWKEQLVKKQRETFQNAQRAGTIELDERGVKKPQPITPTTGANALWTSMRHPMLACTKGTPLYVPDDDTGDRVYRGWGEKT